MIKIKKKVGRPTVDTPITRQKIEEATALDASIEEVCFFADISKETYYQLIKKDREFSDRLDALRQNPILKARQTIIAGLGITENAQWYAERKRKKEFSTRQEVGGEIDLKVGKLEEIQKATKDILNQ